MRRPGPAADAALLHPPLDELAQAGFSVRQALGGDVLDADAVASQRAGHRDLRPHGAGPYDEHLPDRLPSVRSGHAAARGRRAGVVGLHVSSRRSGRRRTQSPGLAVGSAVAVPGVFTVTSPTIAHDSTEATIYRPLKRKID